MPLRRSGTVWTSHDMHLGFRATGSPSTPTRILATSSRQAFASLRRGMPTTLPPPSAEWEKDVVTFGRIPLEEVTSIAMVGSPDTVRQGLESFVSPTHADEVMIVSHIYDHAARVRSYEIAAALMSG